MNNNSKSHICYGFKYNEDYKFPWGQAYDLQDWWLAIKDPKIPTLNFAQYYESIDALRKQYPLPVSLVNYQTYDTPAYILAIPSSCLVSFPGAPIIIPTLSFSELDLELLIHFVQIYAPPKSAPNWFLSSFYDQE